MEDAAISTWFMYLWGIKYFGNYTVPSVPPDHHEPDNLTIIGAAAQNLSCNAGVLICCEKINYFCSLMETFL